MRIFMHNLEHGYLLNFLFVYLFAYLHARLLIHSLSYLFTYVLLYVSTCLFIYRAVSKMLGTGSEIQAEEKASTFLLSFPLECISI